MAKLILRVDAFAEGKYKENREGVYYLKEDLPATELQKIATRARLPVTAFIKHLTNNQFHIRWYTMNTEVELCGHATMAASYSIAREFNLKEIQFQSKSGSLKASVLADGKITMDFPTQVNFICIAWKITGSKLKGMLNLGRRLF